VSNFRSHRVFVTATSSLKSSGIAQDYLHQISICGASGSSSEIPRAFTSPLTSNSGLLPRLLRLISGLPRCGAYLSILDCPPPGGSPDLKNQSCAGCRRCPRQNHLTSADTSISMPDNAIYFHHRSQLGVAACRMRYLRLVLRTMLLDDQNSIPERKSFAGIRGNRSFKRCMSDSGCAPTLR
jgi:hypothetical protein